MPPIQFGSFIQFAGTAPLKWLHETQGRRSAGLTKLENILSPYLGYAIGGQLSHRRVSTRTQQPKRTVPFVSLRDLRSCARDTKWNFHAQPGHALETPIRTAAQRLSKYHLDTCQRWFDGWPLWEDGHRPSQHCDRTDGWRLRVPPLHTRTAQHRRLGTVSC